ATGAAATFGPHTITASGGTAANYNVTMVDGTLTVSKAAALTVTADNKNKVYGGVDPALTSTPSGTLYYTDTYAVISGVSLSTVTGAAATAGPHLLTASGGTAANYNVTMVAGTLTVSKASTATALVSSLNPACLNSSIIFTATVTDASAGSTGTPTGKVIFKDGPTSLVTNTLNASGVATYTTTS